MLAVGAVTLRRTRDFAEVPYAAIPIIFGTQQLIEGFLWHVLPGQTSTTHVLANAYVLFSHVLWPFYVPVAVWMIEPRPSRRQKIAGTAAVGTAVSLFFLVAIIVDPVSVAIKDGHISYLVPHPYRGIALTAYIAATCLAPMLSSHKMVRVFGVVLTGSMLAAYLIYFRWFSSVWCFFAALMSITVYLHYLRGRMPSDGKPRSP